jgi:RHS repeat-associated protein
MNLASVRVTHRFNRQQVAMHEGATLTFINGDHLGSTSVTVNISGAKVSEVRYYPFGETRYSSGTTSTTKCFNAKEQQTDIGLYDLAIGRFVSADSVVPRLGDPQALNRYAYALNNPTRYTDSRGHSIDPHCPYCDKDLIDVTGWSDLTKGLASIACALTIGCPIDSDRNVIRGPTGEEYFEAGAMSAFGFGSVQISLLNGAANGATGMYLTSSLKPYKMAPGR